MKVKKKSVAKVTLKKKINDLFDSFFPIRKSKLIKDARQTQVPYNIIRIITISNYFFSQIKRCECYHNQKEYYNIISKQNIKTIKVIHFTDFHQKFLDWFDDKIVSSCQLEAIQENKYKPKIDFSFHLFLCWIIIHLRLKQLLRPKNKQI